MKKIILLMVLIITIACSQYTSYDDCYVSEMSKMPDNLIGGLQWDFSVSVHDICKKYDSN